MFESNSPKTEELDRAGKLILMAATASESEIEAAAAEADRRCDDERAGAGAENCAGD